MSDHSMTQQVVVGVDRLVKLIEEHVVQELGMATCSIVFLYFDSFLKTRPAIEEGSERPLEGHPFQSCCDTIVAFEDLDRSWRKVSVMLSR